VLTILFSIFYKLASACITRRIKPVLARLIGKEQKAYLSENNIGSVVMNLINMIHFCNTKKKEALILLVDFQKAFDSINHEYIDKVLKLYGFGESIRRWVQLFFDKREAVILLGGHLSEKIFLKQGVPQGDVISPYIFLLVVEILSIKVNYTKNLTGIVFAKKEGRSEFFADDLSALVERTEKNLRNFSRILTLFHAVSGLKCNLDKTFVIPVGNFAKGTMCEDLNLKWVDSFTVLGITIDNRLKYLQDNFQRIYDKVDKKIGTWIRYGLTFLGRITVAKSLLLSQYTYVATILDSNDKKITDKIQSQINLFVYQNKVGTKDHPNFKKWVSEDIYHGGKPIGGLQND